MSIKNKKDTISKYICAKDKNKSNLLKDVFTSDAKLDMELKTQNISFPSTTIGLNDINEVLISKFNETYENIYTFCINDSIQDIRNSLTCNWLVGMSEKENKNIRIGCGKYYWYFDNEDNILVNHLIITIEHMVILPKNYDTQISDWLQNISYPWCDSKVILENIPTIKSLKQIEIFIKNNKI